MARKLFGNLIAIQKNIERFEIFETLYTRLPHLETIVYDNGIYGPSLSDYILSSATISTDIDCPAFKSMDYQSGSILQVAIQPVNPHHCLLLSQGLQHLAKADPYLKVSTQNTGQYLLECCGEVHLQRCIKDLHDRFAPQIELHISDPLVAFRESLAPELSFISSLLIHVSASSSLSLDTLPSLTFNCNNWSFTLQAMAMPDEIFEFLENHKSLLLNFIQNEEKVTSTDDYKDKNSILYEDFWGKLRHIFSKVGGVWRPSLADSIWSFGPRHSLFNLLFFIDEDHYPLFPSYISRSSYSSSDSFNHLFLSLQQSLISGFRLACLSGPVCEEPLSRVCFIISSLTSPLLSSLSPDNSTFNGGPIISCMKEASRRVFSINPIRLIEPILEVHLSCPFDAFRSICNVLAQRRGSIIEDYLIEGTPFWHIMAHLPMIESLGFVSTLRDQTSGLASPQLIFSHWRRLDIDPYWVPITQDEIEEHGQIELENVSNYARELIIKIRKRKGLFIKEKVIRHAEKQRTLKKNK